MWEPGPPGSESTLPELFHILEKGSAMLFFLFFSAGHQIRKMTGIAEHLVSVTASRTLRLSAKVAADSSV